MAGLHTHGDTAARDATSLPFPHDRTHMLAAGARRGIGVLMMVAAWILLPLASLLSTVKLFAFLIGIIWAVVKGGSMAARMRANAGAVGQEADDERVAIRKAFNNSRPVETCLIAHIRPRPLRGAVRVLFHGVGLLALDVGFSLGFMGVQGVPRQLKLLTATLAVVLLLLQLLTTLLRSLIFGAHDARLPDMQIPGLAAFREWAVYRTAGVNVAVYVLLMTGLITLVFAQLYYALDVSLGGAFHGSDGAGPLTWIYFSAVTVATVGFGDIYPTVWPAQLATAVEIGCGPLLLTWLVSSYLTRIN